MGTRIKKERVIDDEGNAKVETTKERYMVAPGTLGQMPHDPEAHFRAYRLAEARARAKKARRDLKKEGMSIEEIPDIQKSREIGHRMERGMGSSRGGRGFTRFGERAAAHGGRVAQFERWSEEEENFRRLVESGELPGDLTLEEAAGMYLFHGASDDKIYYDRNDAYRARGSPMLRGFNRGSSGKPGAILPKGTPPREDPLASALGDLGGEYGASPVNLRYAEDDSIFGPATRAPYDPTANHRAAKARAALDRALKAENRARDVKERLARREREQSRLGWKMRHVEFRENPLLWFAARTTGFKRASLAERKYDLGGWGIRAPESMMGRMLRFGGPVGLAAYTVVGRDTSFAPQLVAQAIQRLSVKGSPLNRDWRMQWESRTNEVMDLRMQHERVLGTAPLLVAESNGYHPVDGHYSSMLERDRMRLQRGGQDIETAGVGEVVTRQEP